MSVPRNTGMKVYTLLVEYNSRTGLPTGRIKPNLPSDPHYIPPEEDLINCPLGEEPIIEMMDIEAIIESSDPAVEANFKLMIGTNEYKQEGEGIWNVIKTTYSAVIFELISIPTTRVVLIVEFEDGLAERILEVNATGNWIIQGPFTGITKLIIRPIVLGDFSDDFDESYN